ncbi:GNAT family N-acetyltransferase [Ulvibacterium marinum]|uniref:N-acetyltransferase n=1 Tax=Ulvibacterium marinum TaxID=2419782 RepID=A0A3B0C972_9FLAO|nr:GNAT family N-acetyltransferase [Ulvibacterium marinum]RKN81004.1 N-acetyltransferase [Ulvibacterium marinum]
MEGEFYIATEREKMDTPFIHKYLSENSYWAKGRTMELVLKSMENSLCFGVFNKNDQQVAFARLVTDYVVFAWLMDVFVDSEYASQGIGKMLVRHIVQLPELRNVNGIGLRTNDAHGFYEKFGFEKISEPQTWMLRKNK